MSIGQNNTHTFDKFNTVYVEFIEELIKFFPNETKALQQSDFSEDTSPEKYFSS